MSGKSGLTKLGLELQITHYVSTLGLLDRLDAEHGDAGREARDHARSTARRLLEECIAELAEKEGS